jgi:arylsulfatase A-like enzyme
MIAWPGTIRPRVEDTTLAAMDLMPTLLRVAGAPVPNDLDGVDLSALLLKGTKLADRIVYWDYKGQSAARSGEWKLILNHSEGLESPLVQGKWLSNLREDSGEKKNYAEEKPEVVAKLADAIATWKAKYR